MQLSLACVTELTPQPDGSLLTSVQWEPFYLPLVKEPRLSSLKNHIRLFSAQVFGVFKSVLMKWNTQAAEVLMQFYPPKGLGQALPNGAVGFN